MKVAKLYFAVLVCLLLVATVGSVSAQTCDTVNGTRFNLESRTNAVPQNTESVDFLLNRVSPGVDLVVGAARDRRGSFNTFPGFPPNLQNGAYYVHRAASNCTADFEGSLTSQTSATHTIGTPTVVADPARDAFFLSDNIASGGAVAVVGRTTAANLLSTATCPNGTHDFNQSVKCWPVVTFVNFPSSNPNASTFLSRPYMAVDPRTSGTGAGDVYVAGSVEDVTNFPAVASIQIVACTNSTVSCSSPVIASGSDTFGSFPYIQVRPDGIITVSYWTFTQPNVGGPNPIDIKFATCTPQGAPKPLVCSAPTLVAKSSVPASFAPAANGFTDVLFPKHANRLEADGKTVTTFLIYDRCRSIIGKATLFAPVCSKVDVLLSTSVDNGATWSSPRLVSGATGHQYMGAIRTEPSTAITSIAYYSTQKDPFEQRTQVVLNQIAAGSTTIGPATTLTSGLNDPSSGIADLTEPGGSGVVDYGDRIGLAAAGTGTKGQSRLYVHYTWNSVPGISNGVSQPDSNNTLVPFSY
jgi:hypothetical protein